MGVQMVDAEVWRFLAGLHTGIVTTLRRDGSPVPLPVWFVVLDDGLYFSTLTESAKMKRIAHDPRIGFLGETGEAWADLRAAIVSGKAKIVEDAGLRERIERELNRKYAGFELPGDAPEVTKRHYATAVTYLRIDPDRPFLTWDNRKIRRTAE